MNDIFIRCLISMIVGWFLGFLATRNAFKPNGVLKLVYDRDDPAHPAMGLEVDSLKYILSHNKITLKIVKIGFPDGPIQLKTPNDKSA